MTWDITTPTGSDNISNGDNIIREFKTDIQAALKANDATLGDEGVFLYRHHPQVSLSWVEGNDGAKTDARQLWFIF